MFSSASVFNQDLSKWDVSAVTDMGSMFYLASTFNQDLSKWDVSAVTNMESMFYGASSFKRELSGVAWGHSKADKTDMFKDSPGSISKACTRDNTAFSPQSKEELQDALENCRSDNPSRL